MKATLRFDLEDQHDREAHLRCTHSLDLVIALSDIRAFLSRADESDEITKDQLIHEIRGIFGDLPFSVDDLSS